MRNRPLLVLLALALILTLVLPALFARAAGGCAAPTITWVGGSSSWHTASNWDAGRVPTTGDHVCIPDVIGTTGVSITSGATVASVESAEALTVSGGSLTLTSTTDESKVNHFNLSGGTLAGAGNLIIPAGGSATWTAGTMTGTGGVLVAGADGSHPAATLTISTTGFKSLNGGRVLENRGEATLSGRAIDSGGGAVVRNAGTLGIVGDSGLAYNQGGIRTHVENTGSLQKSGTGVGTISASVDNDGTVDVPSGAMELLGGTGGSAPDDSTGDFAVASGAALRLGESHRISGDASSVGGAGAVSFPSGTSTVAAGSYDVSGSTGVAGAVVTFSTPVNTQELAVSSGAASFNADAQTETFTLSGGTLGGTGTLTVPSGGRATWTAGTMTGAGTTLVSGSFGGDPAATLEVSGTGFKGLNGGRVLHNAGTTTLTGRSVDGGGGAVVRNSGNFVLGGDAGLFYNQGGAQPRFENTGTLRKDGSTGTTPVDLSLDNDGTVEVSSGVLDLRGGTGTDLSRVSGGDFVAGAGGELRFSGSHRVSGPGSSVSGGGTISFPGAANSMAPETYDVSGITSVSGGDVTFTGEATTRTLTFSSGTIRGTGTLTVPAGGTAQWTGGNMTEAGRVVISAAEATTPAATLEVSGTGFKSLNASRVLENRGEATLSGRSIDSGGGAVIQNSGVLTFEGATDLLYNQGGIRTHVENTGTLRRAADAETSTISASVDNDGTVDVPSGAMELLGGTGGSAPDDSTGDYAVASGAALRLGESHRISGDASSVGGAGAVSFPSGTSTVAAGSYDVSGSTSVTGATVAFTTPASTVRLDVQAGAANFDAAVRTEDLNLTGGTLGGTGTLTVPSGGRATWTGGNMTGAGTTLISGASDAQQAATLEVSGTGFKSINASRVLENRGEATLSGRSIDSGGGAVIQNSGTFTLTDGAHLFYNQGGAQPRFENTGLVRKGGGTGATQVTIGLDNDGRLQVLSGTLELLGGVGSGSASGDFEASEGSELRFSNSYAVSGADSSVSGAGTFSFVSGTVDMSVGSYDVVGTTRIAGSTVAFNAPATTRRLDLTGGTLRGTGTLTVRPGGTAAWTGGNMTEGGRVEISGSAGDEPAATLAISGQGFKSINTNRVLHNAGTVTLSGRSIDSGSGPVVENSGTLSLVDNAGLLYNQGGTRPRVENTGTIRKTAGTSEIGAAVDNDGLVAVEAGTLDLSGGTDPTSPDSSSGDFTVDVGQTLRLGGDHRISGPGSSVSGEGTVTFTSGASRVAAGSYDVPGTTSLQGSVTFSTPVDMGTLNSFSGSSAFDAAARVERLNLSGGFLAGSGAMTVPAGGEVTWTAGTMSGSGRTLISDASGTDPAATLQISGNVNKALNGGRVLENRGVATLGGRSVDGGGGAVIQNSGTFSISDDADLLYNQGGVRPRFENTGTLQKTGGSGTTQIQASVANTGGTVRVASGTLDLFGGLSNFTSSSGVGTLAGGQYVVQTNATLRFPGADIDVNAAHVVLDGPGSAIVDALGADAIDNLADNDGSLSLKAGRDLTTVGPLRNDGTVVLAADSTLSATGDYTQAAGSTTLQDATSRLAASSANRVRVQGGELRGVGTVEPAIDVSGGTVAPGLSPGILKVAGTFAQGSGGTLRTEVGEPVPGTGHDQVFATSTAALAGTLDIVTPEGSAIDDGDSFTVLRCEPVDCRTGEFDTVRGANLGPGLEYRIHYNAQDVTLDLLDTMPPELAAPDAQTADEGQAETFALGSFEDPNDEGPWRISVDWGDGSQDTSFMTSQAGSLGTRQHTYADDGTYTVVVTVSEDRDGPEVPSGSTTFGVSVANVAPTVVLSEANDRSVQESRTSQHVYEYAISDPGTDTVQSVQTGCGAGNTKVPGSDAHTDDSGSFRCVFPDGDATSTVSAAATDSDGDAGEADTQQVTVDNVAPDAVDDAPAAVDEGAEVVVNVLANDTDPGTDALAVTDSSNGASGTVTCAPGGSCTYTPADQDFNGTDSFTYTASDGDGGSDTATVSVRISAVNDAPVADDKTLAVEEDTVKSLTLTASDVDGDVLTYVIVGDPNHGTLSGTGPDRTYQPAKDYTGPDTFTYRAQDGTSQSNVATVSIDVGGSNDTPTISDVTDRSTTEGVAVGPISFTVGDVDTAPENLTVTSSSSNTELVPEANIEMGGAGAERTVKVTPAAGKTGTAELSLTVADPGGLTATDTFVLTVNADNGTPVADDDSYKVKQRKTLTVGAPGVLDGDTDPDGDALTVTLVTGPGRGTLTLEPDGSFTYKPKKSFSGRDSFVYEARDGKGGTDRATVKITVKKARR